MFDTLAASPDRTQLTVILDTGETASVSAETLRREAQDAWSRRERFDHGDVQVVPGLTITGLYAVGRYAVNVHFSDGHEKAVYPFSYLRDLFDRFDN